MICYLIVPNQYLFLGAGVRAKAGLRSRRCPFSPNLYLTYLFNL